MGSEHKQKVHKIIFATVPSPQPRASSSAVISCRICDRPYSTISALEQHYRDTPVHPKCTRCNIGFVDNAAIQAVSPSRVTFLSSFISMPHRLPKHMNTVHHPMPSLGFSCRICNIAYSSRGALEQHYLQTPVHPNCTRCDIGFVDNVAIQAVSSS